MAIQLQGNGGTVQEVEAGRRAARIVSTHDSGAEVLGHYVAGEPSGVVATPAAAGEIFQLRNSHASNLVVVERVVVSMANAAAVTAAQEFGFDVVRASGWTVQGTLGTAITPVRRRTTMPGSSMAAGDVRVATTAVLGGGTKTIEAIRLASGPGPASNAIGAAGPVHTIPEDDIRYPLAVLGQNEGIVVRNLVAYATGSARFHVRCFWREVTSF